MWSVALQLNSAIYDFHEIFFDIPAADRMHFIAQERAIELEKRYKSKVSAYFYVTELYRL